MACEMEGVGTHSPSPAIMVSTSLAASTSSALDNAGRDSAWVSIPMNKGPSIFFCLRYRQMAWVMARICLSLKEVEKEEPRWPDVPKETFCAATEGSGIPV